MSVEEGHKPREQMLNQVIATERGIKKRVDEEITLLYQVGQKGDPFSGFEKKYRPKVEGGDALPPEKKIVQQTVPSVLAAVAKSLTELFDASATRDFANCLSKGTVTVDGTDLIVDAPTPYLLFLDKYLVHVRTIVGKLPVLSADEEWAYDEAISMFRSPVTQTIRTQKVKEILVPVPATDKHPAQIVSVEKDVQVGFWEATQLSGAIPVARKALLLERIEKLINAVAYARERANIIAAPKKEIGKSLFNWLLAS